MDGFLELLRLTERVAGARERVRARFARGAGEAPGLSLQEVMLDQIVRARFVDAGLAESAEQHYCDLMPAQLVEQQRHPVFRAPLDPGRMPRLRAAFEGLGRVLAQAGVPAPAPPRAGATLGELYRRCFFGRSMPMLYAYAGDLALLEAEPDGFEERVDRNLVGPLVHEMAHLVPVDNDSQVVIPTNFHEALAAWIGWLAFPSQVFPAPGDRDALPGAPWFAALGLALARRAGVEACVRAQAGLVSLRALVGEPLYDAVQAAGWAELLRDKRPHLLPGAFRLRAWMKLLDAGREDELLARIAAARDPLDAADALPWSAFPMWRDAPGPVDLEWAAFALQAVSQRNVRVGATFRVEPLRGVRVALDLSRCEVRRTRPNPEDPDCIGAPAAFPFPPAVARALSA